MFAPLATLRPNPTVMAVRCEAICKATLGQDCDAHARAFQRQMQFMGLKGFDWAEFDRLCAVYGLGD